MGWGGDEFLVGIFFVELVAVGSSMALLLGSVVSFKLNTNVVI